MNLITFTVALGAIDINEVVRAQMKNLIQQYDTRKMTDGHLYETLRDENSLKSIRNELLNNFRKTVNSTGAKLSEQKMKNDKSAKTATKSTKRNQKLSFRLENENFENFETPRIFLPPYEKAEFREI